MSGLHDGDGDSRLSNSLGELMFGAYDDHDLDEIPGATHWPEVLAVEAAAQWGELRDWVEQLQERFSHLDHHVVPRCWWRHNEHVEALSALRDLERSSFAATAPATAPVDWFRALRDVTAMLRSWTGDLSCGAVHQDPPTHSSPPAAVEWNRFLRADVDRRQEQEIESSNVPEGDGA
jgi:hypothetical protein